MFGDKSETGCFDSIEYGMIRVEDQSGFCRLRIGSCASSVSAIVASQMIN
ncbi:unnamed protein product [Schistosoma mattheei]|uniref:Uncharacterized protein n=1 Tax=Schistosoma mattheei TaxID=31246 RepID=A0A3P8KN09_9TREM|nr:unnamed protein product [Schistosoma mattheei]